MKDYQNNCEDYLNTILEKGYQIVIKTNSDSGGKSIDNYIEVYGFKREVQIVANLRQCPLKIALKDTLTYIEKAEERETPSIFIIGVNGEAEK